VSAESSGDVTRLLDAVSHGRADVLPELLPLVYDELRRLAASYLRRERADHTLQPTALVHEAYLKLVDQRLDRWQNRSHFFGIAAQAMRRILVDHARAHDAAKRGAGVERVTLDEHALLGESSSIDLIALDEALTRLATLDPRQARIVELRFFAGLEVDETARVLDVSPATVKRDWAMARAWLHRELATARG
jgi:RNA polymerase sigma factor (TIGR02999 family)